jgi:transglutaminase-like putative cysteine protease
MPDAPLDLTIRCGFDFAYDAMAPTPIVMFIQPQSGPRQSVENHLLAFTPQVPTWLFQDWHGNLMQRFDLPPGRTSIRHDAFVTVPSVSDEHWLIGDPVWVTQLPPEIVRYALPSRYCDSDKLMSFAQSTFGGYPWGLRLVQAICDWIHHNIEYRFGSGSPFISASEIIARRYGVCRDFAHTAVALTRCFNIPARYVTGYVPDVGVWDPGTPMDFHAYMEVYVNHRWHTFDARFNEPRIGRVKIACGLDAVDGAFSTLFGPAQLSLFQVWAYQVDPQVVQLGDPIDMSKRLDGTPTLNIPPRRG